MAVTTITALSNTNHVNFCRIASSFVSSAFARRKTPGHNRTPGWIRQAVKREIPAVPRGAVECCVLPRPFSVKAVSAQAAAHLLPALTLTRGPRHLAFLPGGRALVFLRGGIQHKDLRVIDLQTGAERQL